MRKLTEIGRNEHFGAAGPNTGYCAAREKSILALNEETEWNFHPLSPLTKYIVRNFKETFLGALHIILP